MTPNDSPEPERLDGDEHRRVSVSVGDLGDALFATRIDGRLVDSYHLAPAAVARLRARLGADGVPRAKVEALRDRILAVAERTHLADVARTCRGVAADLDALLADAPAPSEPSSEFEAPTMAPEGSVPLIFVPGALPEPTWEEAEDHGPISDEPRAVASLPKGDFLDDEIADDPPAPAPDPGALAVMRNALRVVDEYAHKLLDLLDGEEMRHLIGERCAALLHEDWTGIVTLIAGSLDGTEAEAHADLTRRVAEASTMRAERDAAHGALAACVEALTAINLQSRVALDERTGGLVDAALARARAPGRVVASVPGHVDSKGAREVWIEVARGLSMLALRRLEHPALAALPVGARVRVVVVVEPVPTPDAGGGAR